MTVHSKRTILVTADKRQKGSELMEKIRISLAAARVNAEMSQEEVAERLGRTRQTVSNWESGKAKIGALELYMLSDLYSIPVENIKITS